MLNLPVKIEYGLSEGLLKSELPPPSNESEMPSLKNGNAAFVVNNEEGR